MRNRKVMPGFLGLALAVGLGACAGEEKRELPDDTGRLLEETLRLTDAYADSIATAPDSSAAISSFERFRGKLDSLNNAVAPDTDLLFTEGENDTLYTRIMSVKAALEARLLSLGPHAVADTIASESIEIVKP